MFTSAHDLSKILGDLDSVCNKFFRGIFPIDRVNSIETLLDLNDYNLIVINTDKYGGHGKHWCLIYFSTQGSSAWVDPFAKQPQHYDHDLGEFLDFYAANRFSLSRAIQSPNSTACGLFIIYFAHKLCQGQTLQQIEGNFTSNFQNNVEIVIAWFRSTYKFSPRQFFKATTYNTVARHHVG